MVAHEALLVEGTLHRPVHSNRNTTTPMTTLPNNTRTTHTETAHKTI